MPRISQAAGGVAQGLGAIGGAARSGVQALQQGAQNLGRSIGSAMAPQPAQAQTHTLAPNWIPTLYNEYRDNATTSPTSQYFILNKRKDNLTDDLGRNPYGFSNGSYSKDYYGGDRDSVGAMFDEQNRIHPYEGKTGADFQPYLQSSEDRVVVPFKGASGISSLTPEQMQVYQDFMSRYTGKGGNYYGVPFNKDGQVGPDTAQKPYESGGMSGAYRGPNGEMPPAENWAKYGQYGFTSRGK